MIESIAADVRAGRLSVAESAASAVAAIEARERGDAPLNAFLSWSAQSAIGSATGRLAGVSIAVKDNICTLEFETTCGSRILEGYRSPYEATAIRKLKAEGAVVIGKTNMDEFAMGSSTEHSAYGPTHNPRDWSRVPGGSSGGSAAAVAAGLVHAALGSETGGSVRQPAAFCGVVGIKPSYGRVSRYGLVAFASSLDQIGVFGRTVADAATLLEVISGQDAFDSTIGPAPVPSFEDDLRGEVEGMVIGVPREYFPPELDPSIAALCRGALDRLANAGAEIRDVSLPHTQYAIPTYYVIAPAEASSNLARYDGVRYGPRADARSTIELYANTRSQGFGAEVKRRIMLGTYALSAGYYEAYYGRAQRVRSLIAEDFRRVFSAGVDVLFTPTTPSVAFRIGEKSDDPYQMYLSDIFTVTANLAAIPGISVPVGTVDGLPVGGQFLADRWNESAMIRAGAALEEMLGVMSTLVPVIGLEVHVQLKTRTKLFCGNLVEFGAPPNTHVCPVCLGLPGALPVLNDAAIELAARAGLGLNCTVHETSIFARKNYFYPDLPKGYQITQFDRPIATSGWLSATDSTGADSQVRIRRIHLEEDAGKSLHDRLPQKTAVDLNRAGTPLVEIVTEPDLESPAQARVFLTRLKQLLQYLDVSDCDMEKGSLRVDANVSLREADVEQLGTKTEVKNMNSFANVERALEFEIARQASLLEKGGRVTQETLLWDAGRGEARPMRSKEESHDYRYFPDPDLPPLVLSFGRIERIRAALPELPMAKAQRFREEYGIPQYDAGVLTADKDLAEYFENVAAAAGDGKAASNWVMVDVLGLLNQRQQLITELPLDATRLGELIRLVNEGVISTTVARQIVPKLIDSNRSAREIVETEGLAQVSDGAQVDAWISDVIAANAGEVARFRAGEEKLFGFLMGQVMKRSKGKVDPKFATERMRAALTPETI